MRLHEKFGISVSDDTVYRALNDLSFSHVSAPRTGARALSFIGLSGHWHCTIAVGAAPVGRATKPLGLDCFRVALHSCRQSADRIELDGYPPVARAAITRQMAAFRCNDEVGNGGTCQTKRASVDPDVFEPTLSCLSAVFCPACAQ